MQAGADATLGVTPPVRVFQHLPEQRFLSHFNSDWTASSDATWCTVTSSGSGSGTLVAIYDENIDNTERTANISVSVSGLPPLIVQVIQYGNSVVFVTTIKVTFVFILILPKMQSRLVWIIFPVTIYGSLWLI